MIDGLIATTFAARNQAHIEHWNTKSYAEHVALGDFYDSVLDLVDTFVEAYQGKFGLVGKVKLVPSSQPLLEMLKEDVVWFEENHDEICKGVSALGNLLDTITELYLKTIYKLENLE